MDSASLRVKVSAVHGGAAHALLQTLLPLGEAPGEAIPLLDRTARPADGRIRGACGSGGSGE
jgi:hypothetical protein